MRLSVIITLFLSLQVNAADRLEIGLSYFGLSSHTERYDSPDNGRIHVQDRTDYQGSFAEPSFGVSKDWSFNENWGFHFGVTYLGRPKLKTISEYQTDLNTHEYESESFRNHQISFQYQFSRRLQFLDESTYFLLGSSRHFEFFDEKEQSDDSMRFGIFSMNSYGRRTKDRLAFGLLKDIHISTDLKGSIRWQHLYSTYGPIELFSFSLLI